MFNFRKYNNVTDIVIPEGITLSNVNFRGAFYNMRNLQNVYLTSKAEQVDTTFQYCYNLIEPTVCGPNVNRMENTYSHCTNLRNAVCGDNVTSMWLTYNSCTNLTTAVCGPNVKWMYSVYSNCYNLKTAVLNSATTYLNATFYNCYNLESVTLPSNLMDIYSNTFYNCGSLTEIVFPPSIKVIKENAFSGCSNMQKYDFSQCTSLPTLNSSAFSGIPSNCVIILPSGLYSSAINETGWSNYTNNIIPDSNDKMVNGDNILNDKSVLMDTVLEFEINTINFNQGSTPTISITSDNTSVATVSDIILPTNDNMLSKISFKVNALQTEGAANINININADDFAYSKTFTINVCEVLPVSYTVENISGAAYGFELNANGYYESKNKGVQSSYAICKVIITNPVGANVYFDCINSGESSYDYGFLSNVDTVLNTNASADSSSSIFRSFKGQSSTNVQTVEYGPVEGVIYVKYIKDYSQDSGNDTLQFKVRFA